MQYDLTRANVILADLEDIGQGQAPAVDLKASPNHEPMLIGTCTRLGLLRLGVRLARAAITARSLVVVDGDGAVREDGCIVNGIIQVFLAEDAPLLEPPTYQWSWISFAVKFVLFTLCVIGLVTTIKWIF